ncbi:hypothetical protein A8926_2730 [Saccharopolyspora spinosa]|uniref:Uncharacterized protein n=1 Tax=Saccharopolyspora spinosa TaxID=60894 RepID=A0A2N3XWL1_SACSN|nr:hypothetical protein A8926_2730 [Saccharopolyspora spinosa]
MLGTPAIEVSDDLRPSGEQTTNPPITRRRNGGKPLKRLSNPENLIPLTNIHAPIIQPGNAGNDTAFGHQGERGANQQSCGRFRPRDLVLWVTLIFLGTDQGDDRSRAAPVPASRFSRWNATSAGRRRSLVAEEIELGRYIVNGEVIDVREDQPTAKQLKAQTQSVPGDWVMANMPGGEVVKLDDRDPLPANAVDYSIVTPFTYGLAEPEVCDG